MGCYTGAYSKKCMCGSVCSHRKLTEIEKMPFTANLKQYRNDHYDFVLVKGFVIQSEHVVTVVERRKEKKSMMIYLILHYINFSMTVLL